MNTEVTYSGHTTVPSDYGCPDGDLAAAVNLIPEDGALRPIGTPKKIMDLPDNYRILYLHRTSSYTHYILHDTERGTIAWTEDGTGFHTVYTPATGTAPYQVQAVGNTLTVLCPDGMHYFLWKADGEAYTHLGTEMPELPVSFGLQAEVCATDIFEIGIGMYETEGFWDRELSEESQTWITSQVLGKVNKFVADNSTNAGRFIYPFFVRYAYRLYDGSLTRHSAPVLMVCSSGIVPLAKAAMIFGASDGKYGFTDAKIQVIAPCHRLDYAVLSGAAIDALRDWGDIISSVDIFISKPIYTYDQNGRCKSFSKIPGGTGYSLCKHTNDPHASDPVRYQLNIIRAMVEGMGYFEGNTGPEMGYLNLPVRTERSIAEDVKSDSLFYLLKSIRIEELSTERKEVDVPDDYLQSLTSREVMTDDYDSHDLIIPRYAFGYNSRLNVANLEKRLFKGFQADTLTPFTNGYVRSNGDFSQDSIWSMGYYVFIKQDGREIIVEAPAGYIGNVGRVPFLYYPNTNAYKAVYWERSPSADLPNYYEVKLEKHDFLNGAFYFNGWEGIASRGNVITKAPTPSPNDGRTVDLPNKIYTSEVDNPFFFPLSGINTVGTGEITGICAAVKALSQGQFGQFPLYAFSTEGVWALEVSATGTYTARQPVTRDVCSNPDSITQTDTAVLFATARGIMLLQGSESTCISDVLSGTAILPLSPDTLPHYGTLLSLAGLDPSGSVLPTFADFLTGCRMLYDYLHRRIIAYNPDVRTAYVFSLKSRQWGMMVSDITQGVNSYPEALAVTTDGVLVDFSQDGGGKDAVTRGLLVTRPIKLGMPDVHKTAGSVIQRGHFRRGGVRGILYASNDLFHWFTVWTSDDHYLQGFSGTPYKYFRIALVTDLHPDECLHAASFDYRPRLTNRMR